MALMGFNQEELSVLSVNFDEMPQWLVITYVDPAGVRPRVQHIHTIRVDPNLVSEDQVDVLSTLRDIIVRALVEERAAPERFTRTPPSSETAAE